MFRPAYTETECEVKEMTKQEARASLVSKFASLIERIETREVEEQKRGVVEQERDETRVNSSSEEVQVEH